MSCLNPFDVQSRHIMTDDGQAESLYAGCGMRGGSNTCWCIGNGQAHQFYLQDKMGALNCMHDQQIVMVKKGENNERRIYESTRR